MRLYKIELIMHEEDGSSTATDYYVEKSIDVRAILSRLAENREIDVIRVLATPDFDSWEPVEVS